MAELNDLKNDLKLCHMGAGLSSRQHTLWLTATKAAVWNKSENSHPRQTLRRRETSETESSSSGVFVHTGSATNR